MICYENIGYLKKLCQSELGVPKLVTAEMLAPAHWDNNGRENTELNIEFLNVIMRI